MLLFETGDNNGNELKIEGENRPLSFHVDNEFMKVTISKNEKPIAEVNLNHEDLVNIVEELTNYLVIIESKKSISDNRRK